MSHPGPPPSNLAGLLPESAILLDAVAADREAAVKIAGELLVRSGSTVAAYTDDMLTALEKFGPYIVIAPGFALAHAQASESVLRTGMSWVRLAEPVPFGHQKNDPVRLVVGLASKDHESHMQALQQMATLISTDSTMAELEAAHNPRELLRIIQQHS